MLGPLFETIVVSEWIKAFLHRGERPELFFWRSKAGLEIDLMIDRNFRLYPMEIKATATLLPGHVESLVKWREMAGDSAGRGLLVASIDRPSSIRQCLAIPWHLPLDDASSFYPS